MKQIEIVQTIVNFKQIIFFIYTFIICLKMNYMTYCIILYQINEIILVLFFLICYSKHMKNTKHGVSPHFSIEALKQRYLECECPRERMRWHAIWLLADTENPVNWVLYQINLIRRLLMKSRLQGTGTLHYKSR